MPSTSPPARARELGLQEGAGVTAVIKASDVILTVEEAARGAAPG